MRLPFGESLQIYKPLEEVEEVMTDNNKQHETQQLTDYTEARNKMNHSMMEDAQRIEGAGPPQKTDFRTLPKPLRIFGYCVIALLAAMLVFGIMTGFMD